jgi:steroid delta-isomerase
MVASDQKGAATAATGRETDMTTARDLGIASLSAIKAGDRQGWLDLFEDDAFVQDPVGPSRMDPSGNGHHGKAAIAAFYDLFKQTMKSLDFDIHHSALGADEVAAYVTLHIATHDGHKFDVPVLNVYKMSKNGKIASLRSFWEGG